ncbi:unnamed protein product, partial [marine sediment metagenome]
MPWWLLTGAARGGSTPYSFLATSILAPLPAPVPRERLPLYGYHSFHNHYAPVRSCAQMAASRVWRVSKARDARATRISRTGRSGNGRASEGGAPQMPEMPAPHAHGQLAQVARWCTSRPIMAAQCARAAADSCRVGESHMSVTERHSRRPRRWPAIAMVIALSTALLAVAACGGGDEAADEWEFQRIGPSDRVFMLDDLAATGFKKQKEY